VVAALLTDNRYAIPADRSVSGSPATWGDAVVKAHDDFDADDVVVETNFGGDMATEVVKQAAQRAFDQGRRASDYRRKLPGFAHCASPATGKLAQKLSTRL
jgi:phage terminase large subunit-like protein